MYFAANTSSSSGYTSLLLIVAIGLAFYFVLLRPMKRRQQNAQSQQQQMRSGLSEGDKIVTIGGLYGTVVATDDESVTLEISPGVTARYDRNAIARVLPVEADNVHTFEDDENVVDGADLDYGSDSAQAQAPAESADDEARANPKSAGDKTD